MAKKKTVVTADMPLSDADWQAKMDADTIANHAIIMNDPSRIAAAQKMAQKMIPDKAKQMEQTKMEHDALSNLAMKDKKKDIGNASKLKTDKSKKMEKKQIKKMDKPKTKVPKKEK